MIEKDRKEWAWGVIGVEEQRHHLLAENLKMTPEDRLRLVQELRETFYGNETSLPRLQRLSDHPEPRGVRYMVVGGWAVGWHGWPRMTRDIEIWVAVDSENAGKVRSALRALQALGPIPDDFFDSDSKNTYFMGTPPTKIEIISSIDGVEFEDCFDRSEIVEDEDISIRIIGLEDLVENNKASGRLRDLADLEGLGRLE